MSDYEARPYTNLEELRRQMVRRLSLVLIGAASMGAWILLPRKPFPVAEFWLIVGLMGLGVVVFLLRERRPTAARHLLVWGLNVGLAAAMWTLSEPWIPFLGLSLIIIGAMLVSRGELVIGGVTAALAAWLTHAGLRLYALPGLLTALALGVILAWMTVHTLYTALEWAWTMQVRADDLLRTARDRQGELGRALRSAQLTATILDRTRRELITERRYADEARRAKEQFAANISHELRTPLNLILGFSELMYHSPELYGDIDWPPRLRRAVYQIYRSSRHLLELIDDVLTLSHLEMTGFILHREPASLSALVAEAAEIAADLFKGRPIQLEVEIEPALPVVEIDRTRIRQVLLNLFSNASRFTDHGSVHIRAMREGPDVVVHVHDTGTGIPAAKLSSIFEEFYQVDTSPGRRHGGTGLGLAISRHFVEAHDGRIWVESTEGVGSTFSFSLPVPGESVPVSRLHRDQLGRPVQRETVPSILVADSDLQVTAQVRNHLPDYEVVRVEDKAHLGRYVELHHPKAVVYNVPPGTLEGQGYGISSRVPIIECSLPSESWLADDLAVAACFTKPIRAERILQLVEQMGSIKDVLIVDDDRGFRQLVEQILETSGRSLKVRHASDGAECVQAMRERPPDLLLLDLVMPQFDGFFVMEAMRKDPAFANVTVALLTATSFAETALMQHDSSIAIRRPGGLSPAEVLRCVQAVIAVLEPRYDERSVPGEAFLPLAVLPAAN